MTTQSRTLRRLRAEQRGVALPAAVIVLAIVLLLMAAAMFSSLAATDQSRRQVSSEQALQAAEVGLRMGVYQTNALGLDLGAVGSVLKGNVAQAVTSKCLLTGALLTLQPPAAGNWCGPVSGTLPGGATWQYWLSPTLDTTGALTPTGLLGASLTHVLDRDVVAVGTAADGSQRRLHLHITATGDSSSSSLLGIALGSLSSLDLSLYAPKAGSWTECHPAAPQTPNPLTGC